VLQSGDPPGGLNEVLACDVMLDLQQSLNEVLNDHEQSILVAQESRRALSDGFRQQVCLYSRQSMASLE
jgi:maltoporin